MKAILHIELIRIVNQRKIFAIERERLPLWFTRNLTNLIEEIYS